MPTRLIDHQRGQRYGEIIAAYAREGKFEAEVYGTQMLNDCPRELWDAIDPIALAAELGAVAVKKNGPRYWVIDGLGVKGAPVEPVLKEFSGLLVRLIAVIPLGESPEVRPYVPVYVDRRAQFFWNEGEPIFEIVNPQGEPFIMQALCTSVDLEMTIESLHTLGERLTLPAGWTYRVSLAESEIVVDTTDSIATVIQDEFENSYTAYDKR